MLLQSARVRTHTCYRHIYSAQCQLFSEKSEKVLKVNSTPKLSLSTAVLGKEKGTDQ